MSSDSDDDDELLQMALKEQAQRDLNYQGPSSNQRKPVVNFVQQPRQQPPPQRPASTTNMANQPQQPKNRRAVEEEEDSEVEMLSISSGDEEVSKDRGGEGGAAARGRAGLGSGGREEESGWDGEEPDCWKRVDEAELSRRVRDMRESRTAPVAQKFERKPSAVARKGLVTLQSFPRGLECIDPLGLGITEFEDCLRNVNYSHALGNIPLSVDSQPVDLTGEEVDALRGKFIRRLTAVITHHIPAFGKLLSLFSVGNLQRIDLDLLMYQLLECWTDREKLNKPIFRLILLSSQVSAESNVNASATKSEEKIGDGRYSNHSLDEVAGMIRGTISAYETKVHNTFRDLEESNILRSYMSDAIKEISKACQAFEVKESAPSTAVMALRTLQAEMTKIYILRLCSWMRTTTEEISKEETWIPVYILERNKSPYTISFLPLAFRSVIGSAMDQTSQMIQSLRSEAGKSEDMFALLQEIEESVRLTFLNCFLDFAGHLEQIGSKLALNKSSKESLHLQNGYSHESEEKSSSDLEGSIVDSHQQLLLVLSNIGYCKDELSYELFNKYKMIWSQSRGKDEEDSDIQDLLMSFSGLEEKVLAQYTFAKANLIRTAAMDYLLNSGVQWGAAPVVKGVRDAAVELLHTLVAVHSEVFACAKPLLDKTLGILVEGLIDTFLSLYDENKSKDLRSLDANGFCQLMFELEYFETILNPYLTPDARESLKSLQGVLLEKATENVTETVENPGHQRRSTRGSEDALADDRQQGMTVSPDDLIALAQQCSSELLQSELERTRINTACFVESIPLDSVPESAKAAYSCRGSIDSSRNFMDSPGRNYRGTQPMGSPSFSRHRRR
ncbi:hypothetical protein POTOM_021683 [Populus tomentosa]|uniref:Exocyst complex component SEC5 n=1 Tax=Populus tomentosa TaxID=118781 RepID=A0A8X7ZSD0_POPTO|nr:hypothetical protein POTOM_021683 [Populus tomentosa]